MEHINKVNIKELLVNLFSEEHSWETRLKKLRGIALIVVGYLLSPLCWWNDLVFNLPAAYGFGYLSGLISPNFFLGGTIAGYWLSNLVGFLFMQLGAGDVLQEQNQPRNLGKELLVGIATSTVYTLVILAVVQLKIVDISAFIPTGQLSNTNPFSGN